MRPANRKQDRFFLWGMIILPILSLCAYIFDAFYCYYQSHHNEKPVYEGLLSTILIVFAYLQYCAPIRSRALCSIYHLFLWILVEIGHLGYLLTYIYQKKTFSIILSAAWMAADIVFTLGLLYCRIYRRFDHHIDVANKHIFHFISRLEVILAIFIPIFINQEITTVTRDNIAFFLLFDFFSEEYEHFDTKWIKSCLYLFVTNVTISVGCEWTYFHFYDYTYEYIADITEFTSACFCCTLILMQFFDYHFKKSFSSENTLSTADSDDVKKPITAV